MVSSSEATLIHDPTGTADADSRWKRVAARSMPRLPLMVGQIPQGCLSLYRLHSPKGVRCLRPGPRRRHLTHRLHRHPQCRALHRLHPSRGAGPGANRHRQCGIQLAGPAGRPQPDSRTGQVLAAVRWSRIHLDAFSRNRPARRCRSPRRCRYPLLKIDLGTRRGPHRPSVSTGATSACQRPFAVPNPGRPSPGDARRRVGAHGPWSRL